MPAASAAPTGRGGPADRGPAAIGRERLPAGVRSPSGGLHGAGTRLARHSTGAVRAAGARLAGGCGGALGCGGAVHGVLPCGVSGSALSSGSWCGGCVDAVSAAARASARRSRTAAACSSVRVRGGSSRTTAGVPAAEFDDQAAAQAFPLDRGGEGGVGRAGRRRPSASASGSTSSTPIIRPRPRTSPMQGWCGGQALQAGRACGRRGSPARSASPFSPDVGEGGGARGHGELVAAEGAGVGAGLPDVQFVAVDDHGERQAAADRLGQHHHVGHDPAVLHRPEGAGPADAGLHLVDDQRDRPGGGDLPHPAHPAVRRGDHPALALDGFEDHAGRAGAPRSWDRRAGSRSSARRVRRPARRRSRRGSGSPAG